MDWMASGVFCLLSSVHLYTKVLVYYLCNMNYARDNEHDSAALSVDQPWKPVGTIFRSMDPEEQYELCRGIRDCRQWIQWIQKENMYRVYVIIMHSGVFR